MKNPKLSSKTKKTKVLARCPNHKMKAGKTEFDKQISKCDMSIFVCRNLGLSVWDMLEDFSYDFDTFKFFFDLFRIRRCRKQFQRQFLNLAIILKIVENT
jgi:hypothetical protein